MVCLSTSVRPSVRHKSVPCDDKCSQDHTVFTTMDTSFYTNFHTLGPKEGNPVRWLQTRLGRVKTAKNADFLPTNRYISETIENRHIVTMENISARWYWQAEALCSWSVRPSVSEFVPLLPTRSSAVAKRPRDATCLSVVSFVAPIVQYLKHIFLLVTSDSDLLVHTIRFCSVVFGVTSSLAVIHTIYRDCVQYENHGDGDFIARGAWWSNTRSIRPAI